MPPTSKFPLIDVSPVGLIVRPLLPVFMTNSFEPLKIPCHHEVDDTPVKYSNKQPFTVDMDFTIKPEPLLPVLVISRGIVSDYVGCFCKFKTLLSSKCPLIEASPVVDTLLLSYNQHRSQYYTIITYYRYQFSYNNPLLNQHY